MTANEDKLLKDVARNYRDLLWEGDGGRSMTARLEFIRDAAGEYRYRICGGNGEPLVTSEGYTRRADAMRGYKDLLRVVTSPAGMALDIEVPALPEEEAEE